MTSQSQPPIPPVAGLRGTPGSPDSAHSAPSADSGEEREGVVKIQDTEVIDATGIGVPGAASTFVTGTPVEPIDPVTDPADDPVVRAADDSGAEDAESYAAGEHDSDRVNDPRT